MSRRLDAAASRGRRQHALQTLTALIQRDYAPTMSTPPPHKPLVVLAVGGPNRITRNPMCVGLGGMPLAHAIARRSLPALIPALGFYWFIDRYQIPVEEAALEAGFGKAYRDYRGTVPRRLGSRGVIAMSRSLMRGGLVTELVEGVECFATARRRIGPAHYCRPRSRCRPLAGPVCKWIRPQWP